jgi:hypothetical protein
MLSIVMLNVIMLSVVILDVTNKPFMLIIVMLHAIMLSVIVPHKGLKFDPRTTQQKNTLLVQCYVLFIVMLNVVLMNVIMLIIVTVKVMMLSVVGDIFVDLSFCQTKGNGAKLVNNCIS